MLEVTRTTRKAVMMNDAIENPKGKDVSNQSEIVVVVVLWRGERSIERLSCLSVHDDNGIEMMMMMTVDVDCPVIDIPTTSSSSSSNSATAANWAFITNVMQSMRESLSPKLTSVPSPPREMKHRDLVSMLHYIRWFFNVTLRVICCVKPRKVPIIIFCTLSTTNTTNGHDDFASRKSERESMTF